MSRYQLFMLSCLFMGTFSLFFSAVIAQDDLSREIEMELQATATPTPSAATLPLPQDFPAPNNSEIVAPEQKIYLIWLIESLGWFFTPAFLVMSITMVALVVMNFLAFRQMNFAPKDFVGQFGEYLDNKQFQEAYEYARSSESLLGKILATGLAKLSSGFAQAEEAMQAVGEEETMRHEHRLGYIALIGKIAPMLGLFGTVVGMIDSFSTIAASAGQPPVNKLAEGIATALFTTEVGLAIAIPALIIYDILKNRLTENLLNVNIATENLMNRFAGMNTK